MLIRSWIQKCEDGRWWAFPDMPWEISYLEGRRVIGPAMCQDFDNYLEALVYAADLAHLYRPYEEGWLP